ncbi:hypothetical protein [Streptomyces sp. NPDC001415]
MKPYNAQVQLLGSFAVLTLCPDEPGRLVSPPERLRRVLALIPASVEALVFDSSRLSDEDLSPATAAVMTWAAERPAPLTVVASPGLGAEEADAASRGDHPSDSRLPSPAAVQEIPPALALRALRQRAAGISRAHQEDHPCAR